MFQLSIYWMLISKDESVLMFMSRVGVYSVVVFEVELSSCKIMASRGSVTMRGDGSLGKATGKCGWVNVLPLCFISVPSVPIRLVYYYLTEELLERGSILPSHTLFSQSLSEHSWEKDATPRRDASADLVQSFTTRDSRQTLGCIITAFFPRSRRDKKKWIIFFFAST